MEEYRFNEDLSQSEIMFFFRLQRVFWFRDPNRLQEVLKQINEFKDKNKDTNNYTICKNYSMVCTIEVFLQGLIKSPFEWDGKFFKSYINRLAMVENIFFNCNEEVMCTFGCFTPKVLRRLNFLALLYKIKNQINKNNCKNINNNIAGLWDYFIVMDSEFFSNILSKLNLDLPKKGSELNDIIYRIKAVIRTSPFWFGIVLSMFEDKNSLYEQLGSKDYLKIIVKNEADVQRVLNTAPFPENIAQDLKNIIRPSKLWYLVPALSLAAIALSCIFIPGVVIPIIGAIVFLGGMRKSCGVYCKNKRIDKIKSTVIKVELSDDGDEQKSPEPSNKKTASKQKPEYGLAKNPSRFSFAAGSRTHENSDVVVNESCKNPTVTR